MGGGHHRGPAQVEDRPGGDAPGGTLKWQIRVGPRLAMLEPTAPRTSVMERTRPACEFSEGRSEPTPFHLLNLLLEVICAEPWRC